MGCFKRSSRSSVKAGLDFEIRNGFREAVRRFPEFPRAELVRRGWSDHPRRSRPRIGSRSAVRSTPVGWSTEGPVVRMYSPRKGRCRIRQEVSSGGRLAVPGMVICARHLLIKEVCLSQRPFVRGSTDGPRTKTVCLQPDTLRCVRCSGVRPGSRLTQLRYRLSCGRGSYPITPPFAPIDPNTLTGVRTPGATHFGRSFYLLLQCGERSHPQRGARCL
jgi:hypothetical protein